MKNKKDIGKDFLEKINLEWYEDSADSHIYGWKSRYSQYKSKKEVDFDLNVNHDPSIEIENAEELLGRKLTTNEYNILVSKFNKAVVKKIDFKKLRYEY